MPKYNHVSFKDAPPELHRLLVRQILFIIDLAGSPRQARALIEPALERSETEKCPVLRTAKGDCLLCVVTEVHPEIVKQLWPWILHNLPMLPPEAVQQIPAKTRTISVDRS